MLSASIAGWSLHHPAPGRDVIKTRIADKITNAIGLSVDLPAMFLEIENGIRRRLIHEPPSRSVDDDAEGIGANQSFRHAGPRIDRLAMAFRKIAGRRRAQVQRKPDAFPLVEPAARGDRTRKASVRTEILGFHRGISLETAARQNCGSGADVDPAATRMHGAHPGYAEVVVADELDGRHVVKDFRPFLFDDRSERFDQRLAASVDLVQWCGKNEGIFSAFEPKTISPAAIRSLREFRSRTHRALQGRERGAFAAPSPIPHMDARFPRHRPVRHGNRAGPHSPRQSRL